ncbi:hypothetical protein ACFFSQ_46770 [Dactylosporangium matsuzakiense]|uniref:hypothetical protein n=1 Tax=Dactylosporangium matsuzakiense TaxID=53360 RepID=UPI0031E810F1
MIGEVLLAVGRLREIWQALESASTLDAAGPRARDQYAETAERLARRLAAWSADREAAWLAIRDRTKPTGAVPAPVAVHLLDARRMIADDVLELAREAFQATYGRPGGWTPADIDTRARGALNVLSRCARDGLPPALGVVLVDQLERLADQAAALVGLGTFYGAMPVTCPACSWRALRLRTESPNLAEWVAECARAECLCSGQGCPCGMTVRVAGRRHVWQRSEWDRVDQGEHPAAELERAA